MELSPRALPLPARVRADWPLAPPRPADSTARLAEVALQFETIIAETLLRSARAAALGDDGLGDGSAGGNDVRAMIDHARAEAIARAAPIGVARLLLEPAQPRPQPRSRS
jgi:Rod binding domain-containing protein